MSAANTRWKYIKMHETWLCTREDRMETGHGGVYVFMLFIMGEVGELKARK